MNFLSLPAVAVAALLLCGAAQAQCTQPPEGPAGWWSGDGHFLDLVGESPGVPQEGVSFEPAEVGDGFRFDGINGAVFISGSSATDLGAQQGFTISAWLKPAGNRLAMWIGWSDNESNYGPYGYLTADNSIYFNLVDSSGQGHAIASAPGTVVTGELQHIALSYDKASGEAAIYRNGVSAAAQNLGSFTASTAQRIVLGRQPPSWGYEGLMDELVFFNRALSETEIRSVCSAGKSGMCKELKILSQPQDAVAYVGVGSRPMEVVASGTGMLEYQWWRESIPLIGQTNTQLRLENPQPKDAGQYTVVVREPSGLSLTNSVPATLQIRTCESEPTNLVAWWAGDGHFLDLTENRADGDAGPAVTFVPGRVGLAMRFIDTPGSEVHFPNLALFQPTNNQITIAAWVKPDFAVTGNKLDTLLRKRDGSAGAFSYNLSILKGHLGMENLGKIVFTMAPTTGNILSTKRIPDDGQFHQVAVTYDGNRPSGNCKIYLDGEQAGGADAPGAIPSAGSSVAIGRHVDDQDYYSSMDLDELVVFDRALTATEVRALHRAGSAGICKPPCRVPDGILSWFTADGNALDLIGTNHGVLQGSTAFTAGFVGEAFSFDGTDAFASMPPVLTNAASFTFEWWMLVRRFTHPDYTPAFCQPCETQSPSCIPGEYWFFTGEETAYGSFRFTTVWLDGSLGDLHSAIPFGTGTWEHLALTYDGGSLRQYRNGQLFSEGSHPGKALGNLSPFWVGKAFIPHTDGRNETSHLDGLIDELSVYRRALSGGEIAAIYAAGQRGKERPKLRLVPQDGKILISWQAVFERVNLLSSNDLGAHDWTLVTQTPSVEGWRKVLRLPITDQTQFYLLGP